MPVTALLLALLLVPGASAGGVSRTGAPVGDDAPPDEDPRPTQQTGQNLGGGRHGEATVESGSDGSAGAQERQKRQDLHDAADLLGQLKVAPGGGASASKTKAPSGADATPGGAAAGSGGGPAAVAAAPVAASAGPPSAGSGPGGPADRGSVTQNGSKAFTKALKLGEQLKSQIHSGDGGLGGEPGAGNDKQKAGTADKLAGGLDPANPRTPSELALAATTGFKGAFDALGLKLAPTGPGMAIVDKDGKPASEARLKELADRIASEPKALLRRPDLFQVLPRERYDGLKQQLNSRPELQTTVFKHVELSQPGDRDFQRSASCEKLSGSCNPLATASYQKGDLVPPEELKKAADSLDGADEAPAEADKAALARAEEEAAGSKSLLDKNARRGIYAKLNALSSAVKAFFGMGPETPSVSAGASAALARDGAESVAARGGLEGAGTTPAARRGTEPAGGGGAFTRAASSSPRRPIAEPGPRPSSVKKTGPWGALGAGALGLLLLVALRRRDD